MYKIMVVEDSKPIARDIVNKIKLNTEITQIETAYDGGSALDILKVRKPDILFADIKLPMMDGLTLIQKAKSMYSSMKCVIISGYDDFEYTHRAMKLQVDDYLLKPVKQENFKKIMSRLIHEIALFTYMSQGELISDILQNRGMMNREEIYLPNNYILSVIKVGMTPKCSVMITKNEIYEAMEMPASDGSVWVADTKISNEKVILFDLKRHSEESIKRMNQTIFQYLSKKHEQLNIIYSTILTQIEQLDIQYIELSNCLSNHILLNQSGVYCSSVSSGQHRQSKLNKAAAVFRIRMENVIRSKNLSNFHSELARNISIWEENIYPVAYIKQLLLLIFNLMDSFDLHGDKAIMEDPNTRVNRILCDSKSYHELKIKLCEQYKHWINEQKEKPGSPMELADQLVEFLRLHIYGNLTMQDIADEFNLSTSYISRIMKNYYNDSPIEYYNKLKIGEAKKLLTEHQEMLVKDIAEILGFYDQHYFSKVFKLYHGLSPVDYKMKSC